MMARSIAMKEKFPKTLSVADVEKLLGPAKISKDKYHDSGVPGVVPGLAWTPVGGDILFIEVSLSKSKQGGKLTLTGNLGDVMKESAVIALEYLKAHPQLAGLKPDVFGQYNVHVHVPEGATPKDGPSAGITMLTALASAFKNKKVKPFTAMTGEITLRGKVLPVGGIKEKILAAKRAGIKDIILCAENKKDILEIKQDYLKGLTFHYVSEMHEVIQIALEMKAPALTKRVSHGRSPVSSARPAGRARR
jgi:ATP-dependent Lon protease